MGQMLAITQRSSTVALAGGLQIGIACRKVRDLGRAKARAVVAFTVWARRCSFRIFTTAFQDVKRRARGETDRPTRLFALQTNKAVYKYSGYRMPAMVAGLEVWDITTAKRLSVIAWAIQRASHLLDRLRIWDADGRSAKRNRQFLKDSPDRLR